MSGYDAIELINMIPPSILDVGFLALVLSLVEISPLKLNPWQWLKSFYLLPKEIKEVRDDVERLKNEFYDDRAFRWRQMIVNRSHRIEDGQKMKQGEWEETIDTIDRYEKYCAKYPDFRNGYATDSIEYLRAKHKEVRLNNDYKPDARKRA